MVNNNFFKKNKKQILFAVVEAQTQPGFVQVSKKKNQDL